MKEEQQVTIKAKCKGLTRLLKIPKTATFETFSDLLKSSFGVTQCQLQYKDEEDELIQLGSDVELYEALKVAEKLSTLKVVIVTSEHPSMEPSDKISTLSSNNTMNSQSTSSTENNKVAHPEDSVLSSPKNPDYNKEKPKKEKQARAHKKGGKRMGFYASLCHDINGLDITTNCEDKQISEKPKKRLKKQKSGGYYSTLAEDVAAMSLLSDKQSDSQKQAVATDNPTIDKLEADTSKMSLEDGKAPVWFNRAINKMTKSISSDVLSALNGAVLASVNTVNGQPTSCTQKMKSDHATYIHDGIYCDACHQVIVGPRYKCGNCPDYDLCEKCEAIEDVHDSSHVFVKLRFPGVGIGRKHGVMIPVLKDIVYKSKNVEQAEEQERTMKEVRKKLKQLAKKKRDEQARLKKGERKMKKFKGVNHLEVQVSSDPHLVFLGDGNLPDGTKVLASSEFTKKWEIMNGGTVAWDSRTKLVFMYGAIPNVSPEVGLPALQPGERGQVSVKFIAPEKEGQYLSVWRASHSGQQFGCTVWCKITVILDENQSDGDEIFVDAVQSPAQGENASRMITPLTPGVKLPPNMGSVVQSNIQETAEDSQEQELPEVDQDEQGTSQEIEHQEVSRSAESTSDTNVVVTASEVGSSSLVGCDLEWDTCLIGTEEKDNDDLLDIEVISNASSEDYCVVPLPPCFDPDIPLSDITRPVIIPNNRETIADIMAMQADNDEAEEEQEDNLMLFSATEPVFIPQQASKPVPISKQPATKPDAKNEQHHALYVDQPSDQDSAQRLHLSYPLNGRQLFVPGGIPASPPGRAVPVNIPDPQPSLRTALSLPPPAPTPFNDDVINENSDDVAHDCSTDNTVRTQPPNGVFGSVTTVTIQPTQSPIVTPAQSTAQFASTLVTGTLATAKRAIGSVTGTMTTLINGNQVPAVMYSEGDDNINIVSRNAATVQPERSASGGNRTEMEQLIDMGFCDRPLNERLLNKYNNDVSKVVTELLHESHNDWSQDRHAPR